MMYKTSNGIALQSQMANMAIDPLEPRKLLTVLVQDGWLRVDQTHPDDQMLLVVWDEGQWGLQFQARQTHPSSGLGSFTQVALKDLKGIEIDLSGGVDYLNIDREVLTGTLPIKIIGGAQNDVAVVDTDVCNTDAEYITARYSTSGYFTVSGNNLLAGGAVDNTAAPADAKRARRTSKLRSVATPKPRAHRPSRVPLPFLSKPSAAVARSVRASDDAGSVFDELLRRLSR